MLVWLNLLASLCFVLLFLFCFSLKEIKYGAGLKLQLRKVL